LEQDALCKLAAAPTDVFNSYGPLAQSAASPLLRGLKRPKPRLYCYRCIELHGYGYC